MNALAVLPSTWFDGQPIWLLLLLSLLAMAAVIKGADWLVDGAAGIALRLGMSKIVVGATIVSLGTTSPECAVSVLAAFKGNAGLALGNGIGSIIADTALIFGLGCVLTRLPADRFILSRQGWVQFGSAAALTVICYGLFIWRGDDAAITRLVGIGLTAALVWYLWISVRWSRRHPQGEPRLIEDDTGPHPSGILHETADRDQRSLVALFAFGLVGLVIVVFSGDVLVQSVSEVAEQWGVPHVVIAATIVAVGTSLPELVVGMTSIVKGHAELLVGNVIGADILNVLFVVGFAALARDLPLIDPSARVPAIMLVLHLPALMLVLVLFRLYIARAARTGYFSRWMGIPLLTLYAAYLAANFLLAR